MNAHTAPIAYENHTPDLLKKLGSISALIHDCDLEATLFHLIDLRASQINQCAYCVKMHNREAHEDGETGARLERVVVWRHVDDFTDREKAALAWTEALTVLDSKTDYGSLRAELKAHFTDHQISVLTTAIAMINLWNRIQVSRH